MMRSIVVLALCTVVASVAHAAAPAAPAAEPETDKSLRLETTLLPAISTYNVELVEGSTQQFVSGQGTFTDKSVLGCDGWNVEQRLSVSFMPPIRPGVPVATPVLLRSGSNTFEARNGLHYRFEDKTSLSGQATGSHKGEAILTEVGGTGTATYVEPAGRVVQLPAGTVFPSAFAFNVVRAAGQGERSYAATVFDGSLGAEAGPLKLRAVIGLPQVAKFGQSTEAAAGQQGTNLAWRVRIGVRGTEGQQARPLFEQGLSLMPNGRAEAMLMDYGEFKLRFTLAKFEPLEVPVCP